MEKEKQVVALSDIKKYLRKQEITSIIAYLVTLLPIIYFTSLLSDKCAVRIIKIICEITGVGCYLVGLSALVAAICIILKLQNNTFFTVRIDTLANKEECIYSFVRSGRRNRLQFGMGYYYIPHYTGFSPYSYVHPLYDMDMRTVYDTAFVGDSFTLICNKKEILLAFNNKFFEIENDL